MSRFMLTLQRFLRTHPHMADLPASDLRPEKLAGDHKSVVLYNGTRTYCFKSAHERDAFVEQYGATIRKQP